jgi:glycosyltransferase involved in cell wall biosynthesis
MKNFLLLTLLSTSHLFSDPIEEKAMVVIIPSYKNSLWCNWNLISVLEQDYANFRVIYIDDNSPDKTADKVEELAKKHIRCKDSPINRVSFDDHHSKNILQVTEEFETQVNQIPAFFSLVANKNRAGALANLYRAIWSCSDKEIVVTLDGDDWFADLQVLKRLNKAYQSKNVWLTHGNLIEYPSGSNSWSEPIPSQIVVKNTFRSFRCPSHLRTFYAWLFKNIKLDDLLYNGDFFSMTWDMAMMYPMIEMCGDRHAFITAPNYVYNLSNPINDNKVNAELQRTLDRYIREQPPYQKLGVPE